MTCSGHFDQVGNDHVKAVKSKNVGLLLIIFLFTGLYIDLQSINYSQTFTL